MKFDIVDLGLIEYRQALEFQRSRFAGIRNNGLRSVLILCRHYPVITLGRNAKTSNILAAKEELDTCGIQIYPIERGGDVTYHGPGQLTVYPLFDLTCFKKDIHFFLRALENIIVSSLGASGIKAGIIPHLTGAWVGKKKIASIGISIKNWITLHGLSINIHKDDMQNFKLIRPCGLDVEMTCADDVLEGTLDDKVLKQAVISGFTRVFRTSPVARKEGGLP